MDYRAQAELFRENAEEIRVRIENLAHEEAKAVFLRLAEDYENLAESYEILAKADRRLI